MKPCQTWMLAQKFDCPVVKMLGWSLVSPQDMKVPVLEVHWSRKASQGGSLDALSCSITLRGISGAVQHGIAACWDMVVLCCSHHPLLLWAFLLVRAQHQAPQHQGCFLLMPQHSAVQLFLPPLLAWCFQHLVFSLVIVLEHISAPLHGSKCYYFSL